jgi:hypothetical protein
VRPLARVVCRGEQPAAATDCRHQAAQGHLTLSGGRTATAYVMSWRVPAIAVTPSHGNLRAARIFGRKPATAARLSCAQKRNHEDECREEGKHQLRTKY